MAALPQTIEELLTRLNETSRTELDLMRDLSEAIRRTDDQLLKEVRSVTMLHEIRRDAIVTELQHLAQRLCALPVRATPLHEEIVHEPVPALAAAPPQPDPAPPAPCAPVNGTEPEIEPVSRAGDWRTAAQRIDAELEQYFGGAGPRH